MDTKLFDLIQNSKVIVFDFDGTIADTEPYSWIAHNKALEKYNIQLTEKDIKKYIGNNDKIIFANIERDFNIKLNFETHFKERLNFYLTSVMESDLQPFEFIKEILKTFSDKTFYILSSNNENIIRSILNKWNMESKFEKVYSMLDLNLNKEHCIQNSQEFFKVPASKLILFEDSTKTINMAKTYNAKTVLIENDINKNDVCIYDYKIKV